MSLVNEERLLIKNLNQPRHLIDFPYQISSLTTAKGTGLEKFQVGFKLSVVQFQCLQWI